MAKGNQHESLTYIYKTLAYVSYRKTCKNVYIIYEEANREKEKKFSKMRN